MGLRKYKTKKNTSRKNITRKNNSNKNSTKKYLKKKIRKSLRKKRRKRKLTKKGGLGVMGPNLEDYAKRSSNQEKIIQEQQDSSRGIASKRKFMADLKNSKTSTSSGIRDRKFGKILNPYAKNKLNSAIKKTENAIVKAKEAKDNVIIDKHIYVNDLTNAINLAQATSPIIDTTYAENLLNKLKDYMETGSVIENINNFSGSEHDGNVLEATLINNDVNS